MNDKVKKLLATTLLGMSLMSPMVSATPTMTQAVNAPQMSMNANDNTNYVLIWHHLDSSFYIDLASIVIKENDDLKWWAQNVVELDEKGNYVKQYTQEFCLDTTVKNDVDAVTRMWNKDTKKWENINSFDTRSRYQAESRGFNIGYMFAYQCGNPVEK